MGVIEDIDEINNIDEISLEESIIGRNENTDAEEDVEDDEIFEHYNNL